MKRFLKVFVPVVLSLVILIGIGFLLVVNMTSDTSVVLMFVAGMLSIAIFILSICCHTPVKETRHVVLPTEDVGLIEFYNKYDVIEQGAQAKGAQTAEVQSSPRL